MRKLVILSFISLDGVMQAPGGPDEDRTGDFKFGGWTVPFSDNISGTEMGKQMGQPFDLLLGRKTYDIFASYWPNQDDSNPVTSPFDKAVKYVVSHGPVKDEWSKTVTVTGDVVAEIKKLKSSDGPMLQVHGSGDMIHTLLANDLADELWLKTYPVILGKGKRLWAEDSLPASFKLTESVLTPTGVFMARYTREGDIQTGSF